MKRKRVPSSVIFLIVAAVILLAMFAFRHPSSPPTAPIPSFPTFPPTPVFPTEAPLPTFTSTPQPTLTPQPTPTPTALPPVDDILNRYGTAIQPYLDRISKALKAPAGYALPPVSEWRVHFLPLDKREYYVQYLLIQDKIFGNPGGDTDLFITYAYKREGCLGLGGLGCNIQNLAILSSLFVERNTDIYFLEELPTYAGGAGSSSPWDMVERTVHPFRILGGNGSEIERILELLVGYTIGVGPTQEDVQAFSYPDLQSRLAILRQAIQSPFWSDRKYASYTLGTIGPDAAVMVPELIKALHDEQWLVTLPAADALGAIGPAASKALPDLIIIAQNPEAPAQCPAVYALGDIGTAEEVIPALIPILEVKKDCVEAASVVLRNYGKASLTAVPALIAIVEDTTLSERDREESISALWRITDQKCEEDINCWWSWWNQHK
jgi:hypothetical protein